MNKIKQMKNFLGDTPLHSACFNKTYDCAQIIASAKGNNILNAKDNEGTTALHKAAFIGDIAVMKILIDGGADVNAVDEGATPLHKAAFNGKIDVLNVLLNGHGGCAEVLLGCE
jgi:ankyrin repeat protein